MKRRALLSLLLALLVTLSAPAAKAAVSAYVWPQSVRQGEIAQLYVSTDAATFNVTVTRQGLVPTSYLTATTQPGVNQAVPESSWANGCGWAPSLAIQTTGGWPSGVYVVTINAGNSTTKAIFVVREDDPGSTGSILMEICTTAYEAYNNFPSPNPPYKSLYEGGSSNGERSYFVSFKRPYVQNNGQGLFPHWELPFIKWAESQGMNLEYCVGPDLAQDPGLESHYALLLSVGHDEYWSKEMRDAVESRIHAGRNVAFFGANTCWWQIRFNPAGDQIICYKSKALDPLFGVDNSRVTVNWYDNPVYRPENSMTGLSYRVAGYVNACIGGTCYYMRADGYGDYTAYNTNHWIYAGTGLSDGDEYGYSEQIVGYETDGCVVQWVNGKPVPTGQDGTPLNFLVLGYSPASYGNATMGMFIRDGAKVFNAASIYWANGLDANDATVMRITQNVVDSLVYVGTVVGVGNEPPAIFSLQNAPNPFSATTRIAFQLPAGDRVRLAVFDVGGRCVTTLLDGPMSAGPHAISWSGVDELGRQVAPGIYLYRLEAGPLLRVGKALKER